jgi:CheY-like chemotaxis protein
MAAHRVGSESAEIGGALSYLRQALAGVSVTPSAANELNQINGALKRIDNLVAEFTEFARPPVPRAGRVNINELCARAASGRTGFEVILQLAPDVPDFWGYEERLLYCLKEMVQNAAKELTPDGSLTIRTTYLGESKSVRIELIDTGKGVKPDFKERIFEPAFRDRKGGTGLGLAIVRRTVEEHNGTVKEIGTHGQGAHFVIEMPVRAAVAPVVRILVVEDNTRFQERMRGRLLSDSEDRRIVIASNEAEAVSAIQGQPFDLVITDVNLEESGGMLTGGLAVLAAVREKDAGVPVIVVSAYGKTPISSGANSVSIEDKVRELGCFAFLRKTSDYLDKLSPLVARALEQRGGKKEDV